MKSSAAPAAVNMARQVKIGGHSRLYSSARTVLGRSTVRNRGGGVLLRANSLQSRLNILLSV